MSFSSSAFSTSAFSSSAFDFGDAAPAVVADQPSGGWAFIGSYEDQVKRRRERLLEQLRLEQETEQIPDETDRQIAQLLRAQEAKDARRQELDRLSELVKQNSDIEAARRYSERVAAAYQKALESGSRRALFELERELFRAQEEEEFLLLAITTTLQ